MRDVKKYHWHEVRHKIYRVAHYIYSFIFAFSHLLTFQHKNAHQVYLCCTVEILITWVVNLICSRSNGKYRKEHKCRAAETESFDGRLYPTHGLTAISTLEEWRAVPEWSNGVWAGVSSIAPDFRAPPCPSVSSHPQTAWSLATQHEYYKHNHK